MNWLKSRAFPWLLVVCISATFLWSGAAQREELKAALDSSISKDTTITRLQTLAEVSMAEADSLRKERQKVDTLWLRAKARVDTVLDPASGATIEEVRNACSAALDIRQTQITKCEAETQELRQTIQLKDSTLAVITFDRDSLRNEIADALSKPPTLPEPTLFDDIKASLKKGATLIAWLATVLAAFWAGSQLP